MANHVPELIDPRLATAIEHPVRIQILSVLREGPSSAARIHRRLDNVSLNLIAHHMKVLKDLDCIELVETVSKRGAREHLYRISKPPILSDQEVSELEPLQRDRLTSRVLRSISEDLTASLTTGRYASCPSSHLSRSPLLLDDEGAAEVTDLLARTLDEVLEIGERSLQRIGSSDEKATPTMVAIMKFPTVGP